MGDSYERVKMNEVFETYHSQALTICKQGSVVGKTKGGGVTLAAIRF